MDAKLRAAELLVQKLSNACESARLEAVAEIRLFSKWDERNRVALAQAGAIPELVRLIDDSMAAPQDREEAESGQGHSHGHGHGNSRSYSYGSDEEERRRMKLAEKAMVALLNLSLNGRNKRAIAGTAGALDAIVRAVGSDGLSHEARGTGAALLQSLMEEEGSRESGSEEEEEEEEDDDDDDDDDGVAASSSSSIAATAAAVALHPGFAKSVVSLLRDGGGKAKGDALRALYQAITSTSRRSSRRRSSSSRSSSAVAADSSSPPPPPPPSSAAAWEQGKKEKKGAAAVALGEELSREGAVGLLLKLAAGGRPKLAEDCYAVLAEMARGDARAAAEVAREPALLPLAAGAMGRGPGADNAAALLLELCESAPGGAGAVLSGAGAEAVLLPAARLASSPAASARAKRKAHALLHLIGRQPYYHHHYDAAATSAATSAPAALFPPAPAPGALKMPSPAADVAPAAAHHGPRPPPPPHSAPGPMSHRPPKAARHRTSPSPSPSPSPSGFLSRALRSLQHRLGNTVAASSSSSNRRSWRTS